MAVYQCPTCPQGFSTASRLEQHHSDCNHTMIGPWEAKMLTRIDYLERRVAYLESRIGKRKVTDSV